MNEPRHIAFAISCKAKSLQLYAKLGPKLCVHIGSHYAHQAMAREMGHKLGFYESPGIWRVVKWRPIAKGPLGRCECCGGNRVLWRSLSLAEFMAVYGLK